MTMFTPACSLFRLYFKHSGSFYLKLEIPSTIWKTPSHIEDALSSQYVEQVNDVTRSLDITDLDITDLDDLTQVELLSGLILRGEGKLSPI